MPRKSTDEIATPFVPGQRLPPPDRLTGEPLQIWHELVGQLSPARTNDIAFMLLGPLLASHLFYAKCLAQMIEGLMDDATADPTKFQLLRRFLREHSQQSTVIAALCTKLRLTVQARRHDRADVLRTSGGVRPWEDWGHARDPKPDPKPS
jgi:hypothetical protein